MRTQNLYSWRFSLYLGCQIFWVHDPLQHPERPLHLEFQLTKLEECQHPRVLKFNMAAVTTGWNRCITTFTTTWSIFCVAERSYRRFCATATCRRVVVVLSNCHNVSCHTCIRANDANANNRRVYFNVGMCGLSEPMFFVRLKNFLSFLICGKIVPLLFASRGQRLLLITSKNLPNICVCNEIKG